MHGPNAMNFNITCVFKRIVPSSYLEFDHLKEILFYKAIVIFTKLDGGTRIEWSKRFDTIEELRPIRSFIARANEENLDKLEAERNEGSASLKAVVEK